MSTEMQEYVSNSKDNYYATAQVNSLPSVKLRISYPTSSPAVYM